MEFAPAPALPGRAFFFFVISYWLLVIRVGALGISASGIELNLPEKSGRRCHL